MHLNVSNLLIVHLEQGEGRNLTIQIIWVQNHLLPATQHTQCTAHILKKMSELMKQRVAFHVSNFKRRHSSSRKSIVGVLCMLVPTRTHVM